MIRKAETVNKAWDTERIRNDGYEDGIEGLEPRNPYVDAYERAAYRIGYSRGADRRKNDPIFLKVEEGK